MRKCMLMSMMVALGIVVATGCATTGKGLSDEEQILKQVEQGIANVKAKNYDAFSSDVSDSFYTSVIGDKKDLLEYLQNADEMGFLDDLDVDLSEAVVTVDGDKAEISPITAIGAFGTQGLTFYGAKEKGAWVITGLDPY